jgi:hypothetical protein
VHKTIESIPTFYKNGSSVTYFSSLAKSTSFRYDFAGTLKIAVTEFVAGKTTRLPAQTT